MTSALRRVLAAVLAVAALRAALFAAPRPSPRPDDAQHLYLRGLLHERFGKPEDALDLYEKAAGLDPGAVFVHETLSALALRLNRTDRALEEGENVARLAPQDPHAHVVLGRVRLARGEMAEADEAFSRALALDPNNDEAILYAAHLRTTSRPQEALALYDRYLANNPVSPEAHARVAELQQRLGQLDDAEASWRRVLEIDPADFAAHLALAHVFEVRQDTASAVAEYEACRFLDPENAGVLMRLGELYFRTSDPARAQDAFRQAFRQSPDDASVNFWLALLAEERKDWEEAARRIEVVARRSPDPGVLLRQAFYESQRGRPRRAVRVLERLRRSDPRNPDYMHYLALALEDADDPRGAARWLEKVVALKPDHVEARFHLATDWDALKRFDRAEAELLKVIELDPRHAVALNYLGYSWADRGIRLDRALEFVRRAVALQPENGAFLDSLGWACFKLGRPAEAEEAMRRATAALDDPVVWTHLGDVLSSRGRVAEAREAWEQGLRLDPKSRDLRRRLKRAGPADAAASARRALARAVAGFRRVDTLAGLARLRGRAGGRSFEAQGLFYGQRPGRVRLEILGPFLAPQALVVRNEEGVHWRPPGAAGALAPEGEAWLSLLGEVLSGDLLGRFDDPAVAVERRRDDWVFRAPFGELTVDARTGRFSSVLWRDAGAAPGWRLFLRDYRREDGAQLPARVSGEGPGGSFTIEFRRVSVNTALDPALFRTPPETPR